MWLWEGISWLAHRLIAREAQQSFCVSWAPSLCVPTEGLKAHWSSSLQVNERGKAEAADLRPGDIIVAINGESAEGMLHAEAQSKIRQSASPLRLQLDR